MHNKSFSSMECETMETTEATVIQSSFEFLTYLEIWDWLKELLINEKILNLLINAQLWSQYNQWRPITNNLLVMVRPAHFATYK